MYLKNKFDISILGKLKISFVIVIVLTFFLGIFSFLYLSKLSSLTEKMYKHPFTISNTVRDINSKIIAMHRSMKDVALSKNDIELKEAIKKVDDLEQSVIKDFQLVFERFLGDESSVRKKYDIFIHWKVIRDEVISLVKNGEKEKAAEITKQKGALYVEYLNKEMESLIIFANNKAIEFLNNTKEEKDKAVLFLFTFIIIIFFLELYISKKTSNSVKHPIQILSDGLNNFFSVLQGKTKNFEPIIYNYNDEFSAMILYINKNIEVTTKLHSEIARQQKEQQELIKLFDKYVIFSKTDLHGIITHASKAFCKISGYSSTELLNQPHNIVRHPDTPKETFKKIWKSLQNEEPISIEIKNRKKDGGHYWVQTNFEPYYVENILVGYSAIRVDITAKKEAQELSQTLELKVAKRTQEIQKIHKHTQDSIEYASLIQSALIPNDKVFSNYFSDYFTIWQPKDIVGGDIYLFEELRDKDECLLMIIDCTGHGVPGAFVTMLVKAIERQIVAKINNSNEIVSPANLLGVFNKNMKQLLKQENINSISNAGFDGGIIYYNKKDKILKFAGAETALFYVENGEQKILKGNRYSVGYKKCMIDYEYKEHIINLKDKMQFYLTTDGYLDQNGGKKGFPFGKKSFTSLLKENFTKSFKNQKEILLDSLLNYQNLEERNDDITMIGFQIDKHNPIEIVLEYDGVITQGIITHYIEIIESKVVNINLMSKLSTIFIELTQNIMYYSKSVNLNSLTVKPEGFIKIVKDNNTYHIKARNIVSLNNKNRIEATHIEIQELDTIGLKQRYKELRKSGEKTHQKGGGIGFYEVAKLIKNFEYNFQQIDEDEYIYEFKGSVYSTKRREL